tara:strand:+ start:150 stop:647 length:498 start_codon:yes stop_codon:yes gene_type:complete
MKYFALLVTLFTILNLTRAQSIAPQSINPSGKSMSQANGSISFTVGDLVILSESDGEGNSLGNAFSAGASVSTVNVQQPDTDLLNVKVYPNPTAAFVHIDIKDASIDKLLISLTDKKGSELYTGTYACISNSIGINTEAYPTGTYFLTLRNAQYDVLGVYKVIKQ